ncbi:MAG: secondary thiamine-phosphate synthase enzyme YjbQ [Candidatus Competibacteraceae bacterium]
MISQKSLTVATTRGRGTYEITAEIQAVARASGLKTGLIHVFVHHTSASLILCENADPAVRRDLETFMARLIPDGAAWFEHNDEGPDDMPAHVRTVLTQNSLTLPLTEGRCALGTWQGIYLWEHRRHPHRRQLTVTVQGL